MHALDGRFIHRGAFVAAHLGVPRHGGTVAFLAAAQGFSMPEIATWTFGSVVVSVALHSLVTITTEPVSATKKLPPEMPMSAVR